jgi:glutaredoxin 3
MLPTTHSKDLVYKMITVYSKNNCPFCVQAKNLLKLKGLEYQEVKIDEDETAKQFIVNQGHRTVPQIYRDGVLLVEGGYQGLSRQDDSWFVALKG